MRTNKRLVNQDSNAYIVGGGIAGLAAAALLVRDGGIRGKRIHVFEQLDNFGGSLDGAGDPQAGYVIRGGRMFETHFGCTFDLFSTIPSLSQPEKSVSEEIRLFTKRIKTSSKSRLVVARQKVEAPRLGLSRRDRWDLMKLALRSEAGIGSTSIEQYFAPAFFDSNFWIMWCSMFAFQPWHSLIEFRRYMQRFMHLMPGLNRLEGIYRTPLNQYDSLVRPLLQYLEQQGVNLHAGTSVIDIDFVHRDRSNAITGMAIEDKTGSRHIRMAEDDVALVTLGSMTDGSTLGTNALAPDGDGNPQQAAWGLWRKIADRSSHFGRPEVFCSDIEKSKWTSFTVTLSDPAFFAFMEKFTGNPAGTGALVTFKESNWLMSVVLPFQPHFANQPRGVDVFWGYALSPDRPGDRIGKPMSACGGAEIVDELMTHLPLDDAARGALTTANCIPCLMPFITSQFMPRTAADRPPVIPPDARNFAFLGQYCEVPEDTVFTVEYSVRTAQIAVYGLLGLDRSVTPIYRGFRDPRVVLRALRALN